MNHKKQAGRLAARRRAWDSVGYPDGFKRPGSYKKPWPRGKGRTHKERAA